jgi:hypothetical protein
MIDKVVLLKYDPAFGILIEVNWYGFWEEK